jgi:hypothetical protein
MYFMGAQRCTAIVVCAFSFSSFAKSQSASLSLTASPNPAQLGQSISLTATANSTGKVTYYDGTVVLGTAPLISGTSVFKASGLGPGVHAFKAIYPGGVSNPASVTVNAKPGGGFVTAQNLNVTGLPESLTVADLNNDGYPDIVGTINEQGLTGPTLSVLLNKGDGTFNPPSTFLNGENCYWVVVGDFNLDGIPDLATASDNGVLFLAGNGDGTFQDAVEVLASSSINLISVADLNSDGIPDLIAFFNYEATAEVLLGNGDGTFRAPLSVALPFAVPTAVMGDFNGDGIPDLAVAGISGPLNILLGRGDGTFQGGQGFPLLSVHAVAAGDVNHDGILDLVAATGINEVSVLLGNGDGTFRQLSVFPGDPASQDGIVSLALSDVNGDGIPDIVGEAGNFIQFETLLGNGDGTFSGPYNYLEPPGNPAFVTADFNRDGIVDFAGLQGGLLIYDGALAPVLTLTANPNPVNVGGNLTLTIQSSLSDATGTVQVSDFGNNVGSVSLSGGSATLEVMKPSVGTHYYQAVYSGDSKYAPSGITGLSVTVQESIGIALTASPNPAQVGQPITLTATVTEQYGNAPVSFFDGTTLLDNQPLYSTQVTFTTTLAAGTHQLRAFLPAYNGVLPASYSLTEQVTATPGGQFYQGPSYTLNTTPGAIVTSDFNMDQFADIAFSNPAGKQVGALLSNGNGTFSGVAWTQLNFVPGALLPAPFLNYSNGLAVVNPAENTVQLLAYYPGGTFFATEAFPVDTNPVAITAADFNGDGLADLITANAGSNDVTVLFSNSLGETGQSIDLPAGSQPCAIAAADFNGDGNADILVADQGSEDLRLFTGNGDGNFNAATVIPLSLAPTAIAVADFNGDGKPDVAVLSGSANQLVILSAQGNGAFAAPVTFNASSSPTALAVADFNGDGTLDIAVSTSSSILVFYGNGAGSFQAPVVFSSLAGGVGFLVAGDFGGVGRMDLAGSIPSTNSIAFVLNGASSATTLTASLLSAPAGRTITLTAVIAPSSATGSVTFFDGATVIASAPVVNGVATAAISTLATGSHSIIARYTGAAGYPPSVSTNVTVRITPLASAGLFSPESQTIGSYDLPSNFVTGDFNGDGFIDLAFERQGNGFDVLLGSKGGAFTLINSDQTGTTGGVPAVAADFNGDGKLDLAYLQGNIAVSFGNGDGTFSGGSYLPIISGIALAVADVNRDGKVDVVATTPNGLEVGIGIGDGTFQDPVTYPAGAGPSALVVADVNNDGFVDVVVSNAPKSGPGAVSVLLGNASGGFEPPQTFPTGSLPGSAVVADFNRDGHLDLAVAQVNGSSISILNGNGDGTFQSTVFLLLPGIPTQIFAADMNGDGIPDLVAFYGAPDAGPVNFAFSILYGRGDGTFQTPANFEEPRTPSAMAIADVNGDGRLDVVLGVSSTNNETQTNSLDVFFGEPPSRRLCPERLVTGTRIESACPALH